MARILRGDIVWADLDPVRGREQAGRRPVLILSQDIFNERSETVIALAITSQEPAAGFPLSFEIRSVQLPKPSWVKSFWAFAFSQARRDSTYIRRNRARVGRQSPCIAEEAARP